MRLSILATTLIIFSISAFGQTDTFRPTIVILYPYEKIVSQEIDKELQKFKIETEIADDRKADWIKQAGDAKNWIKIKEAELEFLKKQDFFTKLTFVCEIYISFKLFEYNPNFLSLPVLDSCNGDNKALKAIAEKYKVDWVLNFPRIKLEKDGSQKKTTVTFQLYNVNADKVMFQKDYVGINKNPGLEFTCMDNEDSWECTLNNLESVALFDILDEINRGKKYWR